MKKRTIRLIIGCGYLGKQLLALVNKEHCWYTNRAQLSDPHSILVDINSSDSWTNLNVLSDKEGLIIYFMVPPSQIDLKIFPEFLKKLSQLKTQRCILISSTVVYGNKDRIVDADSNVEIDSPRAERQYQIEQAWLEKVTNACVVRLAGLYGPGRVIGLKGILDGEIINADPNGWLNLIHVDDAAKLIYRISDMYKPKQIELGCDGHPIKRKEYYSSLAELMHKPLSGFKINESSRGTGRRCDNVITIERTGWQPEYTNYQQGVVKLLSI